MIALANTLSTPAPDCHLLLPEKSQKQAKAEVRKADDEMWRAAVGQVVEDIRLLAKLSLKEFADAVSRDERQVARWISGADRPQFDAVVAVEELRQPLVIAIARLAGQGVEIVTQITVRRSA